VKKEKKAEGEEADEINVDELKKTTSNLLSSITH
jgi:hypothetical protein